MVRVRFKERVRVRATVKVKARVRARLREEFSWYLKALLVLLLWQLQPVQLRPLNEIHPPRNVSLPGTFVDLVRVRVKF